MLCAATAGAIWIAQNQLSEKPSPGIASLLKLARAHLVVSAGSILSLLILCVLLWLLADRREALEKIVETGLVFIRSPKLRPDHLSLVSFNPLYVAHAEVTEAEQKLSAQRRLLILGRPTAGKTRLAFNLAKKCKRHWILRVPPGFTDWRSLNFPRIPYRCKVLWIVDDIDKYLGKSDIGQGERVLDAKCDLRLIVTCRSGHELDQARSDKELAAFLERLTTITCSDFTRTELDSLAHQVGKPLTPDLYDLTPGSVLLGLGEMRKQLDAAGPEAQAVMKAMFLLRTAFIFNPDEKLVVTVTRAIVAPQSASADVRNAVAALIRDGLLRTDQSLTAGHDCYLTLDFFPFYSSEDLALDRDLEALGELLLEDGRPRDLQSLGTYRKARGEYERALPFLQKAAASLAPDPVLAFDLGVTHYYLKHFTEALVAFRQVLNIEPDSAVTLVNIGVTLGELRRSEEEIQVYEQVVQRFGDASEPALRE